MLIEKDVAIIFMLTQVYEGEPLILKCWPYWNDNKVLEFENQISTRVITFENRLFYEKRLIEIKYMSRTSTVEHYYYKEWPDKSCPSEAQSVLNLINKMNIKCSLFDSSPVLVHCSAGIGRTGTFIAISNLIEMMQHEKRIQPKTVVTELRKQRAFLVQNWEQYKFIHQAVLEWCLFHSTLFNIDNRSLCRYRLADMPLMKTEFMVKLASA
jgi:protein tyrosine phosphatase